MFSSRKSIYGICLILNLPWTLGNMLGQSSQEIQSHDELDTLKAELRKLHRIKYSANRPRNLKPLVELDWRIYHQIKTFYLHDKHQTNSSLRDDFERNNSDVKMYLNNFEESTLVVLESEEESPYGAQTQTEKIAWNPLAKYKVIQRFREYIQPWVRKINHSDGNSLQTRISRYLESVYNISNGPDQKDYDATLSSIIKVQYVYNLSAKDIASGFLHGINTTMVLNARDCFLLGQRAVFMTFYRSGMQWLEYALHLKQNKSDVTIQLEQVSDALAQAKIAHDKRYSAKKWDNTRYFPRRFAPLSKLDGTLQILGEPEDFLPLPEVHYITKDTHGICPGYVHPSPEKTKELFCWYESEIHWSLKIGPIKAEFLSMFPQIEVVHFYGIIGDQLVEEVKNSSWYNSHYEGYLRVDDVYADVKFSPETPESVGVLRQIIERISGLRVPESSFMYDLHVLSHTAGVYYPAHTDTLSHPTALVTFLIYFSDVSKGGETYFINANLKVVPRKGSALMIYNLYSCGERDETALHGFCPISFGEKWVTPLWLKYEHQTHLQCLSEPFLRHEILVNGQSKYTHQNEHR